MTRCPEHERWLIAVFVLLIVLMVATSLVPKPKPLVEFTEQAP